MLKYEGFVKTHFLIGPQWVGGGRIIPRNLKTTGEKNYFQPCMYTNLGIPEEVSGAASSFILYSFLFCIYGKTV
jgi:hypothetical protein